MPVIRTQNLADFSGGLNLNPDPYKLGLNESPDLLNVDLSTRGGFDRRGVAEGVRSDSDGITSFWTFFPEGGTARLMYKEWATGSVVASTGPTLASFNNIVGINMGTNSIVRAITFKDTVYLQSGATEPAKWNGTTAHQFSSFAFNNNLENPTLPPTNGKMPKAKFITSWKGVVWVAGVTESGTLYSNRVRWSHPNFPEDWHSKHFIDVDTGHDGDVITGLIPFGDRLLVFKNRSIHVIQGTPPEGVITTPLTMDLGCHSQDAIAAADPGVYFFDSVEGAFLIKPDGELEWVFENIHHAMEDGRISRLTQDQVMLGWGNRRLWVSVPFEGASIRSHVFVLDPFLGGRKSPGGWTLYRFDKDYDSVPNSIGPFLEWNPPGEEYLFLGVVRFQLTGNTEWISKFDRPGAQDDNMGGFDDTDVQSWYQTAWIDLGEAGAKKRWKRPDIVLKSGTQTTIKVKAYADYSSGNTRRNFNLTSTGLGGYLQWAAPGGGGGASNKWDDNKWAPSGNLANQVERGVPLGTARSVALRFEGPVPPLPTDWGVNQIVMKFIPRKVRG